MIVENRFPIILASASPRRYQLLQQIGLKANCQSADIDETPKPNELPQDYVSRLAKGKAQAIASNSEANAIVIGGDTIICFNGKLLGKPQNFEQAKHYWQMLSGQTHQVYSAMAVLFKGHYYPSLSVSHVSFGPISQAQMQAYWQSGEPQDKAGAYGIQGQAAAWINRIEGNYSGIMGLDLAQLAKTLQTINEQFHE